MPNALDQFDPSPSDYAHDLSLAQTATTQVRERVANGEELGSVVRDVIARTARAYLSEPWAVWHSGLSMFLTAREVADLIMWNVMRKG